MKITIYKNDVSNGIKKIIKYLEKSGTSQQEIIKSILPLEDIIQSMFTKAVDDEITVNIVSRLTCTKIKFASSGNKIENYVFSDSPFDSGENIEILNNLHSKIYHSNVSVAYKNGKNQCYIVVNNLKYGAFKLMLLSLLLGAIFGMGLKFLVPTDLLKIFVDNILVTGSNLILKAIKLIVGPLVFFSMASSICGFSDIKSLGRIALKVCLLYVITSFFAILIGYFVAIMFPIGDPSLSSFVSDAANETVAKSSNSSTSILDTIVKIVPTDIITPFVNLDMLQIIFLGILLGLGVSLISNKKPAAVDAIKTINQVFIKITSLIIRFLPIAVFCSISTLLIKVETDSLVKIFWWIPECYMAFVCMFLVYSFLILTARLNPIKFFKGYNVTIITAFSLASSNAAMPTALKSCEDNLGIDSQISAFSIPLGSTINMDGNCIVLIITSFFMANIFGVQIDSSMLVGLFIAILALSIGSPGVPGGCLVCMTILLPQIGIPSESVSIIMGIYTLVSMGMVATNVTGDGVISVLVALSEKLLDLNKYKKN